MGDINTCLKRTFTIFNIIFAIVGGLIILLAVLAQILTSVHGADNLENRTTGLIVLYLVGTITMVIAVLGAYGAHKEKKGPLIAFLVCMVIGSMMMLRVGITTAFARPQMEPILEDTFRKVLPFDQAPQAIQKMVVAIQTQLHCCGMFSHKDWEEVPDSCLCSPEEEEYECQTVKYKEIMFKKSVYAATCFPMLMHLVLMFTDIMLAIVFTLASLALLGLGLSSLMIHQLRHPNRPPVTLTVPVFSPQLPKYQELQNPPSYPGY